jgi:hypothetical protein
MTAVINETCTFYDEVREGAEQESLARPSQKLASVEPAKPAPTDG